MNTEGKLLARCVADDDLRTPQAMESVDFFSKSESADPMLVGEHLTNTLSQQAEAQPLAAALIPYISDKLNSASSLQSFLRELAYFERAMRSQGKGLLEVTAADIKIYKRSLTQAGYRPAAVASKLWAVRTTYRLWACEGLLSWESARAIEAVEAPRVEKNTTPALTQQEANALLEAIPQDSLKGVRDLAMMSAYFTTAYRASAVVRARVGDLEERGRDLYLHAVEKRGRETRKNLFQAADPVRAYLEVAEIFDDLDGPLFRPLSPGGLAFARRHVDRKVPWRMVKQYCRIIGVNPERSRGPGFGVHSLRKTAANCAKNNGATPQQVKVLLTHKSIMTTELYFEDLEQDGEAAARCIGISPPKPAD